MNPGCPSSDIPSPEKGPKGNQGRTTKIDQKSEIACKSVPTVLRCNCHAYQPDATNQLRAVSCGSPKNLLLCKCHAIPTAEICPEYTRNTASSGTEHSPSEKNIGRHWTTLGDIGGHMSPFHAKTRRFRSHKEDWPDNRHVSLTNMQNTGPTAAQNRIDLRGKEIETLGFKREAQ